MTTIDLYRKHKAGEVSREKFLYEVRRDNNLPFITNLTSYDDAVKILKNKGIVTEVDTKEAKATEAVKAEVKAKTPSTAKPKTLHLDVAHPYEYRLGLQQELNTLGEYTDEAFEKAKIKVLKNLAKDANFYTTLLNAKTSPYTFKTPESQDKGAENKLRPDGRLKKELKKDEKANVKDNLGKKEAGKVKPKGVKVMPDKGVTGTQKTIKEGIDDRVKDAIKSGKLKPEEVKAAAEKAIKGDSSELAMLMAGFKLAENQVEEHHNDPNFPGGQNIYDLLDAVASDWGKEDLYQELEDTITSHTDRSGNITPEGMDEIRALLSNWDVLDDYDTFLDDNSSQPEADKKYSYVDKDDELPAIYRMAGSDEYGQAMQDAGMEEGLEKSDWTVGEEIIGGKKHYFLYNQKTGKRKGMYKSKEEAESNIKEGSFMGGADLGPSEDKHAKIKEALKKGLKELLDPKDIQAAKKTGAIVNIPSSDTQAQTQAKSAKLNYKTYGS
jgi:hypothetical protein